MSEPTSGAQAADPTRRGAGREDGMAAPEDTGAGTRSGAAGDTAAGTHTGSGTGPRTDTDTGTRSPAATGTGAGAGSDRATGAPGGIPDGAPGGMPGAGAAGGDAGAPGPTTPGVGTGPGTATGSGSGGPSARDGGVTTERGEGQERLVPRDRADAYASRWDAVKGTFVDEPRRAVAEADALVGELLDDMERLFREQRRSLEQGLDADETSTEDLRLALRRYRSFFDRLLSL